jgi:hypothetical protein
MAIGDTNGSSNGSYQNNKTFEPTYYSRFRGSRVDELSMGINYRSGLMIIELNRMTEGAKSESVASIFLSPMKANMLVGEMKNLLEYRASGKIDPNKAFGVNAGMGEKITFIGFSTDSDKKIYCTIGKFDSNGAITESQKYQFASEYNYALEWSNIEANSLEKVYKDDIEIGMLIQAFEDFSRSASGALGYGTLDLNRYEANREHRRLDQVMDKLGIERRSSGSGSYGNRGDNNFLSNASSKSTSVEEIEDLLA